MKKSNPLNVVKELYLPRAPGERKFFVSHQPPKEAGDPEKNGEKVYKQTGVKHSQTAANQKAHGYNSPEDVLAYDNRNKESPNSVVKESTEKNAEEAYEAHHAEAVEKAQAILSALKDTHHPDKLQKGLKAKGRSIHWGHVGDMNHLHSQLDSAHNQLKSGSIGAYATDVPTLSKY